MFDYFTESDENVSDNVQTPKIEVANVVDAAKVLSKRERRDSTILVFDYSNSRVSIWEYVENELKGSHEYGTMKSQRGLPIDFGDKKCYVKSIGLAAILASTSLPGKNLDSKNKVLVNGRVYFTAFKEGYESGQEYFIKEFKNNRFQSRDTIVSDLHLKFYHGSQNDKPWNYWITSTPLLLSNAIIKEWGYYQGIIYELEQMIDQHPTLFKDFHHCSDKVNQVQNGVISKREAPVSSEFKHSGIFNGNAFELWRSLYEAFEIKEHSRSDVKFIYEEMKKDGYIYPTVNQKSFLDWISDTYQIVVQRTSNHSRTSKRINLYSNIKQGYTG